MGDQMIFILTGIGLIAVGLYMLLGKAGGQKPGQILVEATIVDSVARRETLDGDHPNHRATVSTYPVYEYTVNGIKYRTEGSVAITVFSKNKYQAGNRETVRIDPSRPERIHTSAEQNSLKVFGAAFLFSGVIAIFMVLSGAAIS